MSEDKKEKRMDTAIAPDREYTEGDMQKIFGVSRSTLMQMVDYGRLPPPRYPYTFRKPRWLYADLERHEYQILKKKYGNKKPFKTQALTRALKG